MTKNLRFSNYQKGLRAEFWARWLLRFKGYKILATRWRSPLGELDIVALRGDVLAIVEVKARASLEEAGYAISPRQQKRLYRGALHFLSCHPRLQQKNVRFDAVLVAPQKWPQHIEQAFDLW